MSNKVAVPPTKDALLKSYRKRLKDDIGSMVANFTEIIKLCQISKSEEETQVSRSTLCEEEAFEMQVRAANMVSTNTYNEITNFYKNFRSHILKRKYSSTKSTIPRSTDLLIGTYSPEKRRCSLIHGTRL